MIAAPVLGAIDDEHAGIGSAINYAVSRIAGLLSVAAPPAVAGLAGAGGRLDLVNGFGRALVIDGVLAALGGVLAFVTIRQGAKVMAVTRVTPMACDGPGVLVKPAA